VLVVGGLVVQVKGNRRLRVWGNPLAPLTRGQRTRLIAGVRGRGPVLPEQLPLAKYMAELLVNQRTALTGQLGLVVLFAGQWVLSPTEWRLTMVVVLSLIFGAATFFLRRDVGRAREFLDRYPDPSERSVP
jgi:hypothetical protein